MIPSDEEKGWLAFVERFVHAYQAGLEIAADRQEEPVRLVPDDRRPPNLPRVVICAPHPDDEMLTGALALRLHRQEAASVLVLALTLGSDPARKTSRGEELAAACRTAGFDWCLAVEPLAFPVLRPELERQANEWRQMLAVLDSHFVRESPALVLVPHALDGHPAHRAANSVVIQALKHYTRHRHCQVLLLETEYWQPMAGANLLLGVEPAELAVLLTALARYRVEMMRHPYHLRQPGRMMDNVRRGSELLEAFGQRAADFLFGELYRLSKVANGRLFSRRGNTVLPPAAKFGVADLAALFSETAGDERVRG
jgi:N-acetylglucosamine malate deacetylase 1